MKKLLLISMLIGAMPFSMQAQDDDLYFVPKKKSVEKSAVVENNVQKPVIICTDSSRNIDEYNRRLKSSYQVIDGDTVKNDIIDFSAEQGVYPDSMKEEKEDFELTKKMSRFDDYQLADNAAFWAGYHAGLDMWAWHSPWYYSRYGWYGGWYDPWYSPYYSSWRYGWYDPWYYSYYGWYDPWYYPYYGYYGYYGYPYWGGGGYYPGGGGGGYAHHNHIGTGTIRSDGSTHAYHHGNAVSNSSSRTSSLRDRSSRMSGGRTYSSGNNDRSRSGNFSGYRGNSNTSTSSSRSNSSYNTGSRSSSNSSFGGSRSSSGGGSFSGGSSGGSRGGGGGGGSRLGGRR